MKIQIPNLERYQLAPPRQMQIEDLSTAVGADGCPRCLMQPLVEGEQAGTSIAGETSLQDLDPPAQGLTIEADTTHNPGSSW